MSTLNQKKFDLKGYLTSFLKGLKLMFLVSGGVSPVWKLARYLVRRLGNRHQRDDKRLIYV
jgi:hypothetical protein